MKLVFTGVIKTILVGISLSAAFHTRAQIVTIPDPNFADEISLVCPTCITGDQLDTQCPEVLALTSLVLNGDDISDLTGIEYFVSLEELYCNMNFLTWLPPLPAGLTVFHCHNNQLTSLPALPAGITYLACGLNYLTSLPALPPGLIDLNCVQNQLTSLPALPNTLQTLQCFENNLTGLPALPPSLQILRCNDNNLTTIPSIPSTVTDLRLANNQLSLLPDLPPGLTAFSCHNNPDLFCIPSLPNTLYYCGDIVGVFNLANTQVSCVPNIPPPFAATAVPVCIPGDINNPANCTPASFISGNTYQDGNADCLFEVTESKAANIKLYLVDSFSDTIGLAYTNSNGYFDFFDPAPGDYTVVVDTVNKPYVVNCAFPGTDTTVTIATGEHVDGINFAIDCPPVSDIAVFPVSHFGWAFPGQVHTMAVSVGDVITQMLPDCNVPNGGTVSINVTGNVTYNSPAIYALTPTSVSGNTFQYTVPDFSAIDMAVAFDLVFETMPTAQAGDSICADVSVTLTGPDFDPSNNQGFSCYPVVNSYDPNIKEVYPVFVAPDYDDWLTYTIHFQNTGSAPAFNIKLVDTLDAQVKPNSFELLDYSDPVGVELSGSKATFRFDNIMLPDSASDPEGSIGWIRYRVKPQSGLPDGTEIHNECYIFFDYNAPILTNTATTYFMDDLGYEEIPNSEQLVVYPNPSTGLFHLVLPADFDAENYALMVSDPAGQLIAVAPETRNGQVTLDLTDQPRGIYFIQLVDKGIIYTSRLVRF
jgi:uncharacterized repeat protein (TIGR01451 family)